MTWRRITLSFTRWQRETFPRYALGLRTLEAASGRSEPTRLLQVGCMHGPGSHLRHDFQSKRADKRGGGGLELSTRSIIEVMLMESMSC
jgi:hypothetical protein